MTGEQRDFFSRKYGIDYIMTSSDEKYEYGYYVATNNEKVTIPYKFRLVI